MHYVDDAPKYIINKFQTTHEKKTYLYVAYTYTQKLYGRTESNVECSIHTRALFMFACVFRYWKVYFVQSVVEIVSLVVTAFESSKSYIINIIVSPQLANVVSDLFRRVARYFADFLN